jgi:hypothetical protein
MEITAIALLVSLFGNVLQIIVSILHCIREEKERTRKRRERKQQESFLELKEDDGAIYF